MKRYMHMENITYKLNFCKDHLYMTFADTGKCIDIPYSDIVEIIETKNLYLMKIKTYITVAVTKDSLNNIQDIDWKNFLKEKCTAARKIKYKK